MAEDPKESLQTYKTQLELVEAALTTDPNNEELQKLWCDINEVITLTKNLLEGQGEGESTSVDEEGDSSFASSDTQSHKKWKIGDECSALYSEDGQWYDATIDAITDDGMVALTYVGYGTSDVSKLSMLRERKPSDGRAAHSSTSAGIREGETSRKRQQEIRQLAKKKKQKKFERLKQIDEAHEADKQKWKAFTTKNKKMKGVVKKSIFATPDAVNGRVGIGTCGIGGKPMTEFTHAEKWRKGT